MNELIENVINWADEKGLLRPENAEAQYLKVLEETGETAKAILKPADHQYFIDLGQTKEEAIKDGFGDMAVTVIILAKQTECDLLDVGCGLVASDDNFDQLMVMVSRHYVSAGSLIQIDAMAQSYGFSLKECLEAAWNEIKDRTGKLVDGSFVKD